MRSATTQIAAEWIYQEHVINRRHIQELAREINVSGSTLSERAKQYGIKVRRNPRSNPTFDITPEWLHREHVIKRRTLGDMAREANVAYQTLSVWMKSWGYRCAEALNRARPWRSPRTGCVRNT